MSRGAPATGPVSASHVMEAVDDVGREAAAARARERSPAMSLFRVANVLEEWAAAQRERTVEPVVEDIKPFKEALAVAMIRSAWGPEAFTRVPDDYLEIHEGVAVVTCLCDHVPIVPACEVRECEGCGRGFLFTGSRVYAVAPLDESIVDPQDLCDHDRIGHRQGYRRPVCLDCGLVV